MGKPSRWDHFLGKGALDWPQQAVEYRHNRRWYVLERLHCIMDYQKAKGIVIMAWTWPWTLTHRLSLKETCTTIKQAKQWKLLCYGRWWLPLQGEVERRAVWCLAACWVKPRQKRKTDAGHVLSALTGRTKGFLSSAQHWRGSQTFLPKLLTHLTTWGYGGMASRLSGHTEGIHQSIHLWCYFESMIITLAEEDLRAWATLLV